MSVIRINPDQFIAYNKLNSTKNKAPYIIFHHGLMSGMQSSKSVALKQYCIKNDYNFISFDNFGHGKSSGKFEDQTISSWLLGLEHVIEKLANQKIILLGSSMGGWIAMLYALKHPNKVKALISISGAPDFTEELIWNSLSEQEQQNLQTQGVYNIKGKDIEKNYTYPISYKLIQDGRKHLLLNKEINLKCPTHLIHGLQDANVPHSTTSIVAKNITHNNVVTKFIKDATHSLSRAKDMTIIYNSIEELLL